MTTGSASENTLTPATGGGSWGRFLSLTWNGTDRPKSSRRPHNTYTTYREYTDYAGVRHRKEFKIRIPHPASSQNRVVKRMHEEEHPYLKDYQRRFHDKVSYTVPSNFPEWSVMDIHGATTWAQTNLLDANDQIKLIGKLQDLLDGSDFNLGIALGEMPEVLGLIGDTAGRLGKALGLARKGQFGRAGEVLFAGTARPQRPGHPNFTKKYWNEGKGMSEALASNWLELQYGWLPLLKDVEAGAQMLAHHLNVPVRQSYRVGVRREVNLTRITQVGFNPAQQATGKSVRTHRRSIIARIEEKGTIPQLLGLTNPEVVLWELVPYSFVADWFIPIGQWMSARALVNRLKGTFITSDKRTGRAFCPQSSYFAYQPRGIFDSFRFERTVSSTLEVPMPRFKPLGKVASWQHCANAVGLLVSNFAGKH